jgi:argininosuccinate lyase
MPFRTAHTIASRLMAARQAQPQRPVAELLADVSGDVLGAPLTYSDEEVTRMLSPRHFVEIRRTLGGPAPAETLRAATAAAHQLESDRGWWSTATDALGKAERLLADRAAAL